MKDGGAKVEGEVDEQTECGEYTGAFVLRIGLFVVSKELLVHEKLVMRCLFVFGYGSRTLHQWRYILVKSQVVL